MFKNLLESWVEDIYTQFSNFGDTGLLTGSIETLNSALYSIVSTVQSSAVLPVAYVVLAIFFLLELQRTTVRVDAAGGGVSFGAEVVFKCLFKMVLCKLAVDNCALILGAIYAVAAKVVQGIAGAVTIGTVDADGADELLQSIDGLSLGQQIGMLLTLFVVQVVVRLVILLVKAICLARVVEIYVYVAIAPIPLAMLPSEELRQTAYNFLKSFAAVSMQGAILYLVLSFFPRLIEIADPGANGVWTMVLYALILAVAVFQSGRWAKSICNAM